MSESHVHVLNGETTIVSHDLITLREYILDKFKLDVLETTHSAMYDPIFEYCIGEKASAISIYASTLDLIAKTRGEYVNFFLNIST